MRERGICGAVLLLVAWGTLASAEERAELPRDSVQVAGTGRVAVAPDRVSFTAGVETTAVAVADAVSANNAKTRAVIDAFVAAGVPRARIRTAYLSIDPQYDHRDGRAPQIAGYRVANHVAPSLESVDGVGKLLQAAIEAGANSVSQLSYSVSSPGKAREEALAAAFLDARSKAEVLARVAGVKLGRARSIIAGGGFTPPQPIYRAAMAMDSEMSEVPAEPGLEELTESVTVVFDLD